MVKMRCNSIKMVWLNMLNRMVNIKMVQSTTEMAKCGELTRWGVNIRCHFHLFNGNNATQDGS